MIRVRSRKSWCWTCASDSRRAQINQTARDKGCLQYRPYDRRFRVPLSFFFVIIILAVILFLFLDVSTFIFFCSLLFCFLHGRVERAWLKVTDLRSSFYSVHKCVLQTRFIFGIRWLNRTLPQTATFRNENNNQNSNSIRKNVFKQICNLFTTFCDIEPFVVNNWIVCQLHKFYCKSIFLHFH